MFFFKRAVIGRSLLLLSRGAKVWKQSPGKVQESGFLSDHLYYNVFFMWAREKARQMLQMQWSSLMRIN